MIDDLSLTTEWIDSLSKGNRDTDKILIEKVIRALTLLSCIKNSDLDFIFKGGTALMLMLNKPSRLSIDIDIIIENKNVELELVFEQICKNGYFTHFEKNERQLSSTIEKAHYKFYYEPVIKTYSQVEYIILDILFEANPYHNTIETPIENRFVRLKEKPIKVLTPSFEDILGDKLTAFAPNTTGIPYYKGRTSMSMEIIKQLYDIGNIFDNVSDVDTVRKTFKHIASLELKYRQLTELTYIDVLNDIIETSLCICTRGMSGNCKFVEIQQGIKRISGFIYSERYVIENVIVSASKAAYLANLIKHEKNIINRFSDAISCNDLWIETMDLNKLNKLKKGIPEAFWYWREISKINA